MAYVDKDDLVERFGATELDQLLSADLEEPSDPDDRVIAVAAEASEVIDSWLSAGSYATPIPGEPPAMIKRLACDITRYFLYDNGAPDEVRQRYEDALQALKDIGAGKTKLPIDANEGQAGPAISPGAVATGAGSSHIDWSHY